MFMDKQQVLYGAQAALNQPNQPWYVTVEGDAIVARWNWMDAAWFAPQEVNNETKEYFFTVVLKDNGKYHEIDRAEESSKNVGVQDGKLSFGGSKSSFVGKKTEKSFTFGAGRDNQIGQVGFLAYKFDTSYVKQPVRAYLENCGWKKAGLFG